MDGVTIRIMNNELRIMKSFLKKAICIVLASLILNSLFIIPAAFAVSGINKQMPYQGVLKTSSGVKVTDGNYDIVFKIYDAASGGSTLWTGTHTAGNGNAVTVTDGVFSVLLGSGIGNAMTVDFTTDTLYLGVKIGSDSEMTPRKRIGASGYAFNADALDGLDSLSFLRSDDPDLIASTSLSTILTITQFGTGDIFNLFDGGSEVFTVLDGGNVGIGTTTPGVKFELVGGDARFGSGVIIGGTNITSVSNGQVVLDTQNASGAGLLYMSQESGSFTLRYALRFDTTNNASFPYLTNRAPNGAVAIKTGPATGGAGNEHFRIEGGDGTVNAYFQNINLGVGTTSPSQTLSVNGKIYTNDSIIFADGSVQTSAAGAGLWSSSGSNIYRNTGNVGIGTASPGSILHIQGDTTDRGTLTIGNSDTDIQSGDTLGFIKFRSDEGSTNAPPTDDVVAQIYTVASKQHTGGDWGTDIVFSNVNNSNVLTLRMVINDEGNVGIGDATPVTPLEIVSSNNALADLSVEENYTLKIRNSNNTTGEGVGISFGMSSTNSQQTAAIVASRTGGNGQGDLRFYTKQSTTSGVAPVFAMIIDQNGNIGIGDISPGYKLEVGGGDVNTTGGGYRDAGSCVAGTCASDVALKRNIEPLQNSLERILQLTPSTFEFIDSQYGATTTNYGLIAQEVEPIFPEWVVEMDGGYKGIRYGLNLEMHILRAIQELQEQIVSKVSTIAEFTAEKITATVGYFENIWVNRIHTKELCIGEEGNETCITKSQLDAFINANIQMNANTNNVNETNETDNESPIIKLLGNNPTEIPIGSTYSDLGAVVMDNVNDNLGYTVRVDGGEEVYIENLTLDTSTETQYILTFSATDQAGNVGTAERVVTVYREPEPLDMTRNDSTESPVENPDSEVESLSGEEEQNEERSMGKETVEDVGVEVTKSIPKIIEEEIVEDLEAASK